MINFPQGGNCEVKRRKTIDWCLTINLSFTFLPLGGDGLQCSVEAGICLMLGKEVKKSWRDARQHCHNFSMELAVLNTAEKMDFAIARGTSTSIKAFQ